MAAAYYRFSTRYRTYRVVAHSPRCAELEASTKRNRCRIGARFVGINNRDLRADLPAQIDLNPRASLRRNQQRSVIMIRIGLITPQAASCRHFANSLIGLARAQRDVDRFAAVPVLGE